VSIFDAPNISCVRCMHRHPINMTCEDAKQFAERNRREFEARMVAEFANDPEPPPVREGTKFAPLPESARKPLSLAVFEGELLVCCEEGGVYRWQSCGSWERIIP
jgi:hypothetical protein